MCARGDLALLLALAFSLAASASSTPAPTNQPIPWAQLGANATAQYSGDGLGVIATAHGAQLRCVLQKLEGQVTAEGLSLSSTVPDARDQLHVTASRIGRDGGQTLVLDKRGTVQIVDAHARYVRPGLVEEYSVTADGTRQDFLVTQSPAGPGPLRLHLTLRGARAENSSDGTRLIFETSGRELNYGRLRVTDATGRQLAAWMEIGKSEIGNPKPKLALKVAAESDSSQSERRAPTAHPLPRAAETQSLGENDDPKLGQGEGQIGTSRSLAAEGEGQTSSSIAVWPLSPLTSDLRTNAGLLFPLPRGEGQGEGQTSSPSAGSQSSQTLSILVEDTGALYPLRIDPTFSDANWISMGGIPGANGPVNAAVVDGAGNLYIGGNFTVVGEVIATNIAKWDGANWSALGLGINHHVFALAVSGNDVYAGGSFWRAGGIAANRIAKWNGSSWSALRAGMNNIVYALAVVNSDLYAAGSFSTADGTPAYGIAKWNRASWSPLGSGMNNIVYAMAAVNSDIYAAGAFTNAGGTAASRIAKWDGSSWTSVGSGMNNTVYALLVSGSEVYAGGTFTKAGGITTTNIAKWNGSSWAPLGLGMGSTAFEVPIVRTLAMWAGDLYAGGDFTKAGGIAATNIAKWNGSYWAAVGSGISHSVPETTSSVSALVVLGSNVYAAGAFDTAGGAEASGIAKWDGDSWSALALGFAGANPTVATLALSGSDVYAGGRFTSAGGVAATNIAKWNGSNWSSLGSGIGRTDGLAPIVRALAVVGGDLYAGGFFTRAGGTAANYIAKWNGSSWSALGSGMNSFVYALAVLGTNVYAGGWSAGQTTADGIAKWNGRNWSSLGLGVNDHVLALAASGTNLYAGGHFTMAGDAPANRIAKWDGSSWSALSSGIGGSEPYVSALAVSGTDLFVGGYFTSAGGITAHGVAKWNGSSWSAVGSGLGSYSAYALAVSGDDVYAGGSFTVGGFAPANYIAKWNGTNWSAVGSGVNESVSALAVSHSDLYAGGKFVMAGGKVSAYLAKARIGSAAQSLTASGSSATILFAGVVGYEYHVQRTDTLTPPITWTTLTTTPLSPADDGSLTFTDTTAPPNTAWYRLVQN